MVSSRSLETAPSRASLPAPARRMVLEGMAVLACAVVGVIIFFWPVFRTGFGLVPGNLGDSRFVSFILEHWFSVAQGRSAWRSPQIFFPMTGTLGYSESLSLFTPPYFLARLMGLSPYASLSVTLVTLQLLGFAGAFWLFKRIMRAPLIVAAVGAWLFAFSNMLVVHAAHPQLFAVAFVPIICGLSSLYIKCLLIGDRGWRYGVSAALLQAALLYTSYYIGWFLLFSALIFAGVLLLVSVRQRNHQPFEAMHRIRGAAFSLAIVGLSFLLALLPFLMTYIPAYRQLGARDWLHVRDQLPRVWDVFTVTSANWLWGRTGLEIFVGEPAMTYERIFGIPLGLLLVFIAGMFALSRRLRVHDQRSDEWSWVNAIYFAIGAVAIIAWILMFRYGDMSLWRVVRAAVPGAGAITAVFRYQVVLNLAIVTVSVYVLSLAWAAAGSGYRGRVILAILMTFFICEQLNSGMIVFDGRVETERLAKFQRAPDYCENFAVIFDLPSDRPGYAANIDAAFAALASGIPTINGYSGSVPRGWGLQDPSASGYARAVADWVIGHRANGGLCLLSLDSGGWRRAQPQTIGATNTNLMLLEPASIEQALGIALIGFHGLERNGRWTNGSGRISFAAPVAGANLIVEGSWWNPIASRLRISTNENTMIDEAVPFGPFAYSVPIASSVREIEIDSGTFIPNVLDPGSSDPRQLGVVISRVEIR
jgi:hypothetical protein